VKNIKIIVVFITGIIIGSVISVYATTILNSSDISYDMSDSELSSTNVQDAIDELYKLYESESSCSCTSGGTANASTILKGYTAVVNGNLITGTMANYSATSSGITLTTSDSRRVDVVTKQSGDARVWLVYNSDGVQRLVIGLPRSGYYSTANTVAVNASEARSILGC